MPQEGERTVDMEQAVNVAVETTRTGKAGDGGVAVCDPQQVIRMRTGEIGEAAP